MIKSGSMSDQSLKEDEYFEIVAVQAGSGSDIVSGDFSFGAVDTSKGDEVMKQ